MTDDVIDGSAIRRLLDVIGGDPEDLEELLEEYRSAAPQLAARISGAAQSGDIDSLRIAAHTLKSNARDVGAMRLSRLCEALEHQCRAGEVADAGGSAALIVAEEKAARQALKALPADALRG